VYVNAKTGEIRTVYTRGEYSEDVTRLLEVLKEYGY